MGEMGPHLSEITMANIVSYGSLTMVPLTGPPSHDTPWRVLGDVIKAEECRVSETSDDGSVPQLKFYNFGDHPVFLLDGEELVGGKQNRVINLSILAFAPFIPRLRFW